MTKAVENPNQSSRLLKVSDVANILNISLAFTYKLLQKGEIRGVKIGGARRVRQEDLRQFIKEHSTQ